MIQSGQSYGPTMVGFTMKIPALEWSKKRSV